MAIQNAPLKITEFRIAVTRMVNRSELNGKQFIIIIEEAPQIYKRILKFPPPPSEPMFLLGIALDEHFLRWQYARTINLPTERRPFQIKR